jgi:hypothetical protein
MFDVERSVEKPLKAGFSTKFPLAQRRKFLENFLFRPARGAPAGRLAATFS